MTLSDKQLQLQKIHGKPIKQVLVSAINEYGKRGAAVELGVTRATLDLWCAQFNIKVRQKWEVVTK